MNTKASNIIRLNYQGLNVGFTGDGWFNATLAAEKFGKRVDHWLKSQETKEYIKALASHLNTPKRGDLIHTKRGKNGGTWLHPKLAVAFTRWLSPDFSVWCDCQIDGLIRGNHPHYDRLKARDKSAVSFKFMNDVLKLVRLDEGKETLDYHYQNEAKLLNWLVTDEFKAVERDTLDAGQLALLTALEERNAILLAQRVNRDDRKQKLAQFAQEWRNGQSHALGRAA